MATGMKGPHLHVFGRPLHIRHCRDFFLYRTAQQVVAEAAFVMNQPLYRIDIQVVNVNPRKHHRKLLAALLNIHSYSVRVVIEVVACPIPYRKVAKRRLAIITDTRKEFVLGL